MLISLAACAEHLASDVRLIRKFLTAEQAAEFLGGLNHRTVTRWAREGYLPAIPVGEGKRRLWRFLETDLSDWMLARRTGKLAAATDAPNMGF